MAEIISRSPLAAFIEGGEARERQESTDINQELARQKIGANKQAIEDSTQNREMQIAMERTKLLNNTGKALLSIDESRWGEALQRIQPQAQNLGVDLSQISGGQPLTREVLQSVVNETGAFLQDPASLTAEQRNFNSLTAGLTPEEELNARKVKLRISPAASSAAPQVVDVGGVPHIFDKQEGKLVRAEVDGEQVTAKSVAETEGEIAKTVAIDKGKGEGQAKRQQATIQTGVDASKGIPALRRTLELLDSVKTGGFASASLRAKQMFGLESADEGELSANLGEAVLGDLKATFGAAFTEKEGARLERIRAGFGKSPETNRRLINQSLDIAMKSAEQAMKVAGEAGDYQTAQMIKDVLEFKSEEPQNQSKDGGKLYIDGNGNKAIVYPDGSFEEIQ